MSTGTVATTSYPSVSSGTGPDSIVLQVSENAWANASRNSDANGDAEFTVAVNGVRQGGTFTALAPHATSDGVTVSSDPGEQTFTFNGTFGANPTLAVTFINDAYGGTPQTDRNLYVDSISYDGANQNQSRAIYADKTVTFNLTGPGNDGSGSAGPVTHLHYAPGANLAQGNYDAQGDPGSVGFNLADVNSQADADSLPQGVQALLWLGDDSIAQAESIIQASANDPKVYGYYVADEPADSALVTVKTIDDYIKQYAPTKMSFFVAENDADPTSPVYAATPSNTDADLVGLDPYPVRPAAYGGVNYSVIPDAVHSAEDAGWSLSQIIPVYQAFGNGTGDYAEWTLPTAQQEQTILQTWGSLVPKPTFDYAYSWGIQGGDSALVNTPSLQAVFAQHNAT